MNREIINKIKETLSSPEFKGLIKSKINEDKSVAINNTLDSILVSEDLPFDKDIINDFVIFCKDFLSIDKPIKVNLVSTKKDYAFTTLAYYLIGEHSSFIYCKNRALIDCLRSLAHELVHNAQDLEDRIDDEQTGNDNDGVPIENEANAKAGEMIRIFGRKNPKLYEL